jgi:hypothetical protein
MLVVVLAAVAAVTLVVLRQLVSQLVIPLQSAVAVAAVLRVILPVLTGDKVVTRLRLA